MRSLLLAFCGACTGGGGAFDAARAADAPPVPDAPLAGDAPLAPDAPLGDASLAFDARCDALADSAPPAIDAGADAIAADASQTQICLAAREAWRALVATIDTSCNVPADCWLVGGIIEARCGCLPHVADVCEGVAVNTAALAPVRDELYRLELAWRQACEDLYCVRPVAGCTCDCSPRPGTECINRQCRPRMWQSCFPPS